MKSSSLSSVEICFIRYTFLMIMLIITWWKRDTVEDEDISYDGAEYKKVKAASILGFSLSLLMYIWIHEFLISELVYWRLDIVFLQFVFSITMSPSIITRTNGINSLKSNGNRIKNQKYESKNLTPYWKYMEKKGIAKTTGKLNRTIFQSWKGFF